MAAGTILQELWNPFCGFDDQGNIVLNTYGKFDVNSGAAPIIPKVVGKGIPYNYAITNGVGASSNICNVSFQLQDVLGSAVVGVFDFDLYLSDSSAGNGITATTPSGGIAAVASDGTIIGVLTTSKALKVVTNAAGLFVLAITDTAKTLFYPCAALPNTSQVQVGAQLTTASYHT